MSPKQEDFHLANSGPHFQLLEGPCCLGSAAPVGGRQLRLEGGDRAELHSLPPPPDSSCPGCGRRMCQACLPGPGFHFPSVALQPQPPTGPALPLESMAGTRWVLGALLRGCGCNCSSCRRTGAACLPFYSAAGSFPSGVSGRRRLLLLLGVAAAAASQTRGLHTGPAPTGRLAGPPPAAASAAATAAASYSALRAPLLQQSLAAAAGPARGYSQVRGRCGGPHARAPALLRVRFACAAGDPRLAPRPRPRLPSLPIGPLNKGRSPRLRLFSLFCSPVSLVGCGL